MALGGLQAGAAYTVVGAKFRADGFRLWNSALLKTRQESKREVVAQLVGRSDTRGFGQYQGRLRTAREEARRGVTADLRTKVDLSGFRRFNSAMDQAGGRSQQMGYYSHRLGYALGIGGLAGGFAAAAKAGYQFDSSMESNTIALKQFLGSTGAAKKLLADLFEIAKRTPFEFPDLVTATRKFLAFGFTADQAKTTLKAVGDAVAGIGGGSDEIQRITLALGQMQAKGKVSAEELLQLNEIGIPAQQILRKELHLTGDQVANIGKVGITARDGITALTRGMEERFAGATAAQAKSSAGLLSTLKDDTKQALGSITQGLFTESKKWIPVLDKTAGQIRDIFDRKDLSFGEKISRSIDTAKVNLGPLATEIRREINKIPFGKMLADSLDYAIPRVAHVAAKLALAVGKAFGQAFIQGDPLTRIVLGLFAASKLRGFLTRWLEVGRLAGLSFSKGAQETAIVTGGVGGVPIGRGAGPVTGTRAGRIGESLAGGRGASTVATVGAGGRLAGALGRVAPLARGLGTFGLVIGGIQVGADFLGEQQRRRSRDLSTRLGALQSPSFLERRIPRSFFEGPTSAVNREVDAAKRLSAILDYIQKRRHGITGETKTEAENLARVLGLTRSQRAEVDKITAAGERAGRGRQGLGIARALIADGKITRQEISDTIDDLNRLPKGARKAAADTIVSVATELHKQGKVKGSVHDLKVLVEGGVADVGKVRLDGPRALISRLGITMDQLVQAVADPTSKAAGVVADALDAFGEGANAKRIRSSLRKFERIRKIPTGAGQKQARLGARGGGKIPGYSRRDDVDLRARRGEAILTPERHQPEVDRAMAFARARGVGKWSSLAEMFTATGANVGHEAQGFAQGGYTGPFGSGSGFVPVTNFARRKFGLQPTAGRTNHTRLTAAGRPSDHAWGGAVDYSNGTLTPQEDAFAAFWKNELQQVVKQLIWRDVIQAGSGTGARVPGHTDHVHLALLRRFAFDEVRMGKLIEAAGAGDLRGLLKGLGTGTGAIDKLEQVRIQLEGGAGAPRELAKGMLADVERAANRAIARAAAAASDVAGAPGAAGNNAANERLAHSMMRKRWPDSEWPALRALWTGESHFDESIVNPSSGATGIPQALPGSKMRTAGADWRTNPATQIAWGLDYISSVYGSPTKAYHAWLGRQPHWYERGGFVDRAVNRARYYAGGVVGEPEAEEATAFRYKDYTGKGVGKKKAKKGPQTEQEKWDAMTPQARQQYKDHHGGRTRPEELAHEHAQGGKTDQQVAAERKRAEAQRKAAALRRHGRQLKRRHGVDKRRVDDLARKVAPDLEPPAEEMAGVAYYDTLLDSTDSAIERLGTLFQRQPTPDVFVSRDDAKLPGRAGHTILDVGPQFDTVADVTAAQQRIDQLEHLLTFDYAGRDQIQGAPRVAGAVPRIRKLLDRVKRLQERYQRWLRHLRGLVRVIGALRRERGRKKPDKDRVGDLERQAREHARGIGLDPSKAFRDGKRNLLADSFFLSTFEPKIQADLDKYGRDDSNPLTDAETQLKDQLANYIGAGPGKTGDPLLDTGGGGVGGRLAAFLDQIATDETERASLRPDQLRSALLGQSRSTGGPTPNEIAAENLASFKEQVQSLMRNYGSNARLIGNFNYGGIAQQRGPAMVEKGEVYLGKSLSDALMRFAQGKTNGAGEAGARAPRVHVDKVEQNFAAPPVSAHVLLEDTLFTLEGMGG